MSKIFDALQGLQSETADLLPALMGEEELAKARTAPAQRIAEAAVPKPNGAASRHAVPAVDTAAIRRVSLVVLASVPVLPFEEHNEEAAEQYRIARTKIIHHPKRPRTIAVTSPSTGDGKTVTAINIAGALSLKSTAKVLLVDVDFRRSSVHTLLGLSKGPGLAEIIVGESTFEEAAVEPEEYPNLHVLTSGEPKANPSELLESPRWHSLLETIRSHYEYIVFDTPPMGAVADGDLISLAADGILMVLRTDHTKRSACFKGLETLPKDKLLGILLNCNKPTPFQKHLSSYGYGYGAKAAADSAQRLTRKRA